MERSGLDSGKRHLFLSIAITPLLLLGSFPLTNAHAAGSADRIEPLIAQLDQIRQQQQVGALAYALVEGDRLIASGGFGYHSLAQQRAVNADSLFRVGSVTKTINAAAIQMLASNGELALSDPVRQHLPDIPLFNPWRESTPVTLAMVLEHSAGLQDLTHKEFYYPKPLSLQEAFQVEPSARQVHWKPGLHHSYSNAGAGYAGRVLEQVSGSSWDDWIRENLLQPLEMRRSGTLYSETLQQQLVVGYDRDRKTPIPYWHTLFRPFGALNTSANEFSHFLRLLINRGQWQGKQLLPAEAIERMERPGSTQAAAEGHKYGYGLGLYRYFRDGKLLIGHGGDGDGYLAHFAYNPQSKRGFFVVINAFYHPPLSAMRKPLERWVTAPLEQSPLPAVLLLPRKLEQLSGRYQQVTMRFPGRKAEQEILVSATRSGLSYSNGSQRYQLEPLSESRFRVRGDSAASHIFLRRQGEIYWQSDEGNFRRINEPMAEK